MVSSSFLPGRGGIESYLAELCEELSPHVAVLAQATRDERPLPANLPYEAIGYPGSTVVPSKRLSEAIVTTARAVGTDRVLFGTPWPLALLGPRLKRSGLRYAAIVHGAEMLVPSVLPSLNRALARALSQADLLLPVSEFTRSKVTEFLRSKHVKEPPAEVLRARVDVARFDPDAGGDEVRRSFGLDRDARMLLCFGRLVRRKGVDRVIRCLDDIAGRIGKVALVVAGTGPERRRLERLARAIDSHVVFAGRVADDDAASVYASADVFVMAVADRWRGLDTEGLGVVLLEAAACGVPCVTGRSGGTEEAVVDGVTGFVVDGHDREALVDRVSRLLAEPDHAAAMGEAGRRFVTDAFARRPLPGGLVDWLALTDR